MYKVRYTKLAFKDAKKIKTAGLKEKAEKILKVIEENPFHHSYNHEKLVGKLNSAYSKRTNIQHRLFYEVPEKEKLINVLKMWTHYE